MSDHIYELVKGTLPVLISMPHDGYRIPNDIANRMTEEGKSSRDTDWYVSRLYNFATELGCASIKPTYSRYVVDLNRPENDASLYPGADTTGIVPLDSFRKRPLYLSGQEPDAQERALRIEKYWRPYHRALSQELHRLYEKFGVVVLFEAHSIASRVPRFFDGQLPDLNFGTNDGKSCATDLVEMVKLVDTSGYSRVFDGRFKGGYITRHYAEPMNNIHSIQLELSWRTYLNEATIEWDENKASQIRPILENIIKTIIEWTNKQAR